MSRRPPCFPASSTPTCTWLPTVSRTPSIGVAGFTEEEIDEVVTDGLRRSLAAGVTTVRDLGDRHFNVVARRDRLDIGSRKGLRRRAAQGQAAPRV